MTTQKRIKLQIELVVHEGLCDDPTGRSPPVYRHLITGHLNEWSFDFVCAKDGCAAWDLLTKTRRAEVGSARLGTSWARWCGGLSPAPAPAGN
jgi:hypothetical protein